uniref:Uncharacterized protein n=1 Tax=Psilocybe cubensis TaxID=181762 RepID=A0A8H8CMG3_PSICU
MDSLKFNKITESASVRPGTPRPVHIHHSPSLNASIVSDHGDEIPDIHLDVATATAALTPPAPAQLVTRRTIPPRYPTFIHPYISRPSRTTIRVRDQTNSLNHRIFHIGQIAVFLLTDKRIRAGRFNPDLMPEGYLQFAHDFNHANPTNKRLSRYLSTTNEFICEGEAPTFEDFCIDLTLIGWKPFFSTPVRANPRFNNPKSLLTKYNRLTNEIESLRATLRANEYNSHASSSRRVHKRPPLSSFPPLACNPNPLEDQHDDDDTTGSSAMVTV